MREKINWLAIIAHYDLADEFDLYRKFHNGISIKRAARAFCVRKSLDCSITTRRTIFIYPNCDDEGVYDSPSMKEARKRIEKNVF